MHWRIDAGGQTIALATSGGLPEVIWWGPSLPLDEDLGQLARAQTNDITGGMLDRLPALSLSPEPGRGFQGQPGHLLAEADGTPLLPAFTFDRAEESPGHLTLHSRAGGLTLSHHLTAQATGTITLRTSLSADRPIRVHWLATPALPAPQDGDMIDLHGKWIGEFHLIRTPWAPGIRRI
jgi:alpha-galactosidase